MRPDRRPINSVFACVAVVALAGGSLIAAGAALAQSGDMDPRGIANRLDRIEREISDLQRQTYSGGASSGAPVVMDSGVGTADAGLSNPAIDKPFPAPKRNQPARFDQRVNLAR